jgi:hypothetical protein
MRPFAGAFDVWDGVQSPLGRRLPPLLPLALAVAAMPLIALAPHPALIAKVLMKAMVKK